MSKKNAALTLAALVLCLMVVNFVVMPELGHFLLKDIDKGYNLGKSLATPIAQIFGGNQLIYFAVILLGVA